MKKYSIKFHNSNTSENYTRVYKDYETAYKVFEQAKINKDPTIQPIYLSIVYDN